MVQGRGRQQVQKIGFVKCVMVQGRRLYSRLLDLRKFVIGVGMSDSNGPAKVQNVEVAKAILAGKRAGNGAAGGPKVPPEPTVSN